MESRQHRFCAACCPARRSSASRRSTKSSVGPFSLTPPSIWSYPSRRDSRSWQRRSTHCCPPPTLFESAGWRGGKATKRKIASLVINALIVQVKSGRSQCPVTRLNGRGLTVSSIRNEWLLLEYQRRSAYSLPFEVDCHLDAISDFDERNAAVHAVVLAVEGHRPFNLA